MTDAHKLSIQTSRHIVIRTSPMLSCEIRNVPTAVDRTVSSTEILGFCTMEVPIIWPAWDIGNCTVSRWTGTCCLWCRLVYVSSADQGSTGSTTTPDVGPRLYRNSGRIPVGIYSCTRIHTGAWPGRNIWCSRAKREYRSNVLTSQRGRDDEAKAV